MPTFCRHNRFIERCPICSKTLPGGSPSTASSPRAKPSTRSRSGSEGAQRRRVRGGERVRIQRELRAADDGYRSELVPGLRASADALRLVEEMAFSSGRLLALATEPPELYGEARVLAGEDLERATWTCFLIVYLCPLEGEDPFAGIRVALAAAPGELPDLDGIPLGPRTSHEPRRGADTLIAYREWVARGGRASVAARAGTEPEGSQAIAFTGDRAWGAQRRFERVFERLALPGFARGGRYELLVVLGRLGLYELQPDSLQLAGARGLSSEDPTTLAAKRVFGIGDPLLLERRAAALAQAVEVPVETLDLALANWISPQRATLGLPRETHDDGAVERACEALGL
jgi:alpha-glutamyl/putrescinyl thymine pyrophosphorylase-like protein